MVSGVQPVSVQWQAGTSR